MYTRKSTTGFTGVDRALDDLIAYINRMGKSSGVTAQATEYPMTSEGGLYITGTNGMGYKLNKGLLVKTSTVSNLTFVIAVEGDYNISGVIYEDVESGGTCKVVVSGPADVFFNSNGATRGNYVRMSKAADTVNTDTGKAQSDDIARVDPLRLIGWVFESRSGEGLSRCILKR